MTGYTRFWNCRVCGEREESLDYSTALVCERCIRPLASKICREVLKADLGPGIDENYFYRRAYDYAAVLFGRDSRPPTTTKGGT